MMPCPGYYFLNPPPTNEEKSELHRDDGYYNSILRSIKKIVGLVVIVGGVSPQVGKIA